MHEPIVQALDGEYRIERFVASYPHRENQDIVPARLLKIWNGWIVKAITAWKFKPFWLRASRTKNSAVSEVKSLTSARDRG
jgi:hypothetical protein